MRQAVPLFGRAPHARPGDPAVERRTLEAPTKLDSSDGVAANQEEPNVRTDSTPVPQDYTVAQLAAESFPCTAVDAVVAAASFRTQNGRFNTRTVGAHRVRQPGRSL